MSNAFFTVKLQTLLSMQRSSCSVKEMGLALGIMRGQTRDRLLKVFAVYGNRLNKQSRFVLWHLFLFFIDNDSWGEELCRSNYHKYNETSKYVCILKL
jgi:hypothetical protein